jgi:hypothetical protein
MQMCLPPSNKLFLDPTVMKMWNPNYNAARLAEFGMATDHMWRQEPQHMLTSYWYSVTVQHGTKLHVFTIIFFMFDCIKCANTITVFTPCNSLITKSDGYIIQHAAKHSTDTSYLIKKNVSAQGT